MLTAEIVRELLDYNPETGLFTWKYRDLKWFNNNARIHKAWNARRSGKPAGYLDDGYIVLGLLGKEVYGHRIAWLYVHGYNPPEQIDHENHIRNDNRISNIRLVSDPENKKNMKMRADNKSGINGVHWSARDKRWIAQIGLNGKPTCIGYFKTIEEAAAAREGANKIHNFHPNHGVKSNGTERRKY